MSVKVMSLVWSARGNTLTSSEKSILLRMADYGSEDGNGIYPSITTLSLDTSISRSTVIRVISSLEEKGILKKKHQFRKNLTLTSNLYSINISKLSSLSKVKGSEPSIQGGVKSKNGGSEVEKWGHLNTQSSSVTKTLGVVSPRHQGSVTTTPLDPLIDPPYRNNNSKPRKLIDKTPQAGNPSTGNVVVFCDEEKTLKTELKKVSLNEFDSNFLIRTYGIEKVSEKLKMLTDLKTNPENPVGWLKAACKREFGPNEHQDKGSIEKTSSRASIEETKIKANAIAELPKRAATEESKLAHLNAMKKLRRGRG